MFKELPEIKESMTFNITFHRLFIILTRCLLRHLGKKSQRHQVAFRGFVAIALKKNSYKTNINA